MYKLKMQEGDDVQLYGMAVDVLETEFESIINDLKIFLSELLLNIWSIKVETPCTFEACFNNTVFPEIRVGIANLKTCQKGKFHGITPKIIPRGSNISKLFFVSKSKVSGSKKLTPFKK